MAKKWQNEAKDHFELPHEDGTCQTTDERLGLALRYDSQTHSYELHVPFEVSPNGELVVYCRITQEQVLGSFESHRLTPPLGPVRDLLESLSMIAGIGSLRLMRYEIHLLVGQAFPSSQVDVSGVISLALATYNALLAAEEPCLTLADFYVEDSSRKHTSAPGGTGPGRSMSVEEFMNQIKAHESDKGATDRE